MSRIGIVAFVSVLTFSAGVFAQGGCASGVCGVDQGQQKAQTNNQPMQGMNHGTQQGGGMGMGMGMMMCPMMKQMAQLQERVRMMEDMMGMSDKKKD